MIDLSGSWSYIQDIARSRLAHNKTPYHRYEYGDAAEIMGVAGEIVARRFLRLDERIHEGFDNGIDINWYGLTIDVKATLFNQNYRKWSLQWPEHKNIKSQIILLTAIDPIMQMGVVVGYANQYEVSAAPINQTRKIPCREISVMELHRPWELFIHPDIGKSIQSFTTA